MNDNIFKRNAIHEDNEHVLLKNTLSVLLTQLLNNEENTLQLNTISIICII